MLLYSIVASLGFSALYTVSALERGQTFPAATVAGGIAFVGFVLSFVAPPFLFRYSNAEPAPRVMSQVSTRAITAALIVIAVDVIAWAIIAREEVSLVEELYGYALLAIFLFHGFGGAVASHVVYLQQTHQYNSNQLVAVLVFVTLLMLFLVLYFLAFDFVLPRDPHVHVRDLTAITLVLLGYGRAIYLMAHH